MKNSAAPAEIVEQEQGTMSAPHGPRPRVARHVSVAIKHLVAQRDKAISDRDRAARQVEDLDHALSALGWPEEDVDD